MMKLFTRILALLSLLTLAGCGAEVVDAGYTGVKVRFGEVVDGPLSPNLYWYNPFTSDVKEIHTGLQTWKGEISTFTHDTQLATIHFTATYRLDPAVVPKVYASMGSTTDNYLPEQITQVVNEDITAAIGKVEASNLPTIWRTLANEIGAEIRKDAVMRGIFLQSFALTNLDFSDEYEKAIETKVVAAQNALAEENRTRQKQQIANQKVIDAEAEAKSITIRATALERNAKLVEWEAVQKWDGSLPQYMLGGGAIPFINVPTTGRGSSSDPR